MVLASIHAARTELFNRLFIDYTGAPFAVRTPGGWSWNCASLAPPEFTLVFKTSDALRVLIDNPSELQLGKAFVDGDLDVEGDLLRAFDAGEYILDRRTRLSDMLAQSVSRRFSRAARGLVRAWPPSRHRDSPSIGRPYDLPVEFFRPWLGSTLVYSCAYFRDLKRDDLDSAQYNNLDLICRKLDLERGERFLNIGCGWGSLAMYAASHYGAEARGITLSKEQALVAAHRISQAKLDRQCFVEMRDYRDALRLPYRYDKIASLGIFEDPGGRNPDKYFSIVHRLLKPDGLFLNYGIARWQRCSPRKNSFIDRCVLLRGALTTISDSVRLAESAGFEVRDVDNLREHYAQTLRMWAEAFRRSAPAILEVVPESVYRTWLLYMAGAAVEFERDDISVYQILLRRSQRNVSRVPVTREHWYRDWENTAERRSA